MGGSKVIHRFLTIVGVGTPNCHIGTPITIPTLQIRKARNSEVELRIETSNKSFLLEIYPLGPDNTLKLVKCFLSFVR